MVSPKIILYGVSAGCLAVILWSFPVGAEAGQSIPQVICGPGAESLHSKFTPTFNLAQEAITRIDPESAAGKAEKDSAEEAEEKGGGLDVGSADDVRVNVDEDSAQLVLKSKNGVSPFLDAGMGEQTAKRNEEEYGTALVRNEGPSVYRLGAGIGCVLDPGAQLNFGYQFATSEEPTPLERLTGDAAGNDDEHKISVDLKFSF